MKAQWEPKRGKDHFAPSIARGRRVLDVGCGNNSLQWFRWIRPDLDDIGLDVGDYSQAVNPDSVADEYHVVAPDQFAGKIESFDSTLDVIASSHNLENCDEPDQVIRSMVSAFKPGGAIYLSSPCEESVSFPSRAGCLNFFDYYTHKTVRVWSRTLNIL